MEKEFALTKPCRHVAFIMDGNGRWAKLRGLPRHLGHKEACNRLIEIFTACEEFNIQVMSVYAFSTENWKRPKEEINHLFQYLDLFFKKEINRLIKDGAKVMVSGDINKLPIKTQKTIADAVNRTKDLDNWILNICLNYGGRDEILRACKGFAQDVISGKENLDDLNETSFEKYLYTSGLPNVDLMIRTSGELRLSNFLLWQNAYSEFVFPSTYWPDFTREEFIKCLKIYQERDRRFGGLKNE